MGLGFGESAFSTSLSTFSWFGLSLRLSSSDRILVALALLVFRIEDGISPFHFVLFTQTQSQTVQSTGTGINKSITCNSQPPCVEETKQANKRDLVDKSWPENGFKSFTGNFCVEMGTGLEPDVESSPGLNYNPNYNLILVRGANK